MSETLCLPLSIVKLKIYQLAGIHKFEIKNIQHQVKI